MTANEQLLVELINRARANPLAEVARIEGLSSLNEGLSAGTISSTPKQPLAPHQALVNAAGAHSQDMLDHDYFSHTNLIGQSPSDRARAAGYPAGAGENISWGGSSASIDELSHVFQRHESLMRSPGHRVNLMNEGYREIGTGVRYGVFTTSRDWNASMATEMFASRGGNVFLTGVAYTDQIVDDDFYTVGEGRSAVTVRAVRQSDQTTFSTTTGSAGGYSLQLPNGTYTVTATGGGINGQIVQQVTISGVNVKLDVVTTEGSNPPTDPPPPPPPVDDPPPPEPDPVDLNGMGLIGRDANGQWWNAQSTGSSFQVAPWTSWDRNGTWVDVQTGDFDGDGIEEVIGRNQGNWWVARQTANGITNELWTSWSVRVSWFDVSVADVNGDGRDDLVGRTHNGQWWVAKSNGSSFDNESWGQWSTAVDWNDVNVGDFNGDGQTDIAGRTQYGAWWIAVSTGTSFDNQRWGAWSTAADWNQVKVGDFDGDGRDDIIGRAGASWWVARSSGDAFANQLWTAWSTRIVWQDINLGDFNGDGRDDLIGRANGQWWVALSTGTQFQNVRFGVWSDSIDWLHVRVADFNRDGRDDIVGQALQSLWVAESDGQSFTSRSWGEWPSTALLDDVHAGRFA